MSFNRQQPGYWSNSQGLRCLYGAATGFGDPGRDSMERTVSVACFALIGIHKYEKQLSNNYHAVPTWQDSPADI